eukprot:TRINITY_DN15702_c0_g1_i1.p1 TRINITY_DN15702_c0_g1~~TRINITY_DN15702_c0_g1_i1.p1  ORF type:complete len:769 (-),score=70.87 TRINITY_DN15702_c0_g1_i1:56-2362(-)
MQSFENALAASQEYTPLLDLLPVELVREILSYIEHNIIHVARISITSKFWSSKAYSCVSKLKLDKLDAWRLLDAPFNFQKIESLELSGHRLNIEWAIEAFPIKRPLWRGVKESKDQTIRGTEGLECILEWAPKFSDRLKHVVLEGPNDIRQSVSSRVLEALSASPAAASIHVLEAARLSPSCFSPSIRFTALTKLKLFEFRCDEEVGSILELLGASCPNIEYLLFDLQFSPPSYDNRVRFIRDHRRNFFLGIVASFPRLREVSYNDGSISEGFSHLQENELSSFVEEVKFCWPQHIVFKLVMRFLKRLEAGLPELAWTFGINSSLILFLEKQFPASPEKPRSTQALIKRAIDASHSYSPVSPQAYISQLEMWGNLNNMGSFAYIDASGNSVLSACLRNHPLSFIIAVVERTLKDIEGKEEFQLGAKRWSDLSAEEKSNDRALFIATSSRPGEQTAQVLEYLASDSFPAPLRRFLDSCSPLLGVPFVCEQYGLLASTVLLYHNPQGLCILLRAGVALLPITKESLGLIQNGTVLSHETNLEVIQLLWPAVKPHMTVASLSEIIETIVRVAGEKWERNLPNLVAVIQFFLDQGAVPPVSSSVMRNLLRCGNSVPMDLFRVILDANKPHLNPVGWTSIFHDALADWKEGLGTERLAILLECGADPSRGLITVFQPGWDTKVRWTLELTQFLLENGADPDATDTQGFSALHFIAVYFPDGDMFSEEPDMVEALVALFTQHGYNIPEASAKVLDYINARLEDERRLYDDGFLL